MGVLIDHAGARVTHRDRRVAAGAVLQQQRRHRPANDVGAADDDGMSAFGLDPAADQQLLHAVRRRRPESGRIADGDFAFTVLEVVDRRRLFRPVPLAILGGLLVVLLVSSFFAFQTWRVRDAAGAGRGPFRRQRVDPL